MVMMLAKLNSKHMLLQIIKVALYIYMITNESGTTYFNSPWSAGIKRAMSWGNPASLHLADIKVGKSFCMLLYIFEAVHYHRMFHTNAS